MGYDLSGRLVVGVASAAAWDKTAPPARTSNALLPGARLFDAFARLSGP